MSYLEKNSRYFKKLRENQENTDRQLKELRKTMCEQNENASKETGILKRNKADILDLKSMITEMKS